MVSLIFLYAMPKSSELIKHSQSFNADVCFYLSYIPSSVPAGAKLVRNGAGAIIKCSSSIAKNVEKQLSHTTGVSITFNGNAKDIASLLSKYSINVLEQCNITPDIVSYLGYSRQFDSSILIDNKTINVQIARNKNTITIGCPIILGSY